jgi:Transposase IS4
MDIIVQNTNNYIRQPKDDLQPFARANDWYSTDRGELYLYFAIRIYITLVVLNEISDYWDKTKIMLTHEITKWMSRDRFQELHMRVRLAGMEADGPYTKVSKAPL